MRNRVIAWALLALVPVTSFSAQPTFREKYNTAAKDMVPALQTSSCETKPVKSIAGKAITECRVQLSNSLLSLDSADNKLTGVWLVLDSSALGHPTDLVRAGGVLLRAARGTSYGDYLAVSTSVFDASRRQGWQKACVDDKEAAARFCVSGNERGIFNITLSPI
jgi:hypothetical protein